jgi:hypothetical protein
MIKDEDLEKIRDSARAAWALTIGIIVVVAVVVQLLEYFY